jgi:hypothetical protein|nr:MAG TPA: hypothetical protein [Caudoviricetes sp.]
MLTKSPFAVGMSLSVLPANFIPEGVNEQS